MAKTTGQRWLIISHAFNMDGRAASQTITDKIPHLLDAGIEVVILSGVSGVKDKTVEHHQLWPLGPAGIRFELRHVLRRRFSSRVAYRLVMSFATLLLLPGLIVEKLFFPLESSWSWWWSAYRKGRTLSKQKPFDLIYSTGGAYAAHLAARALKQTSGIPWLAEVHDPFITPGVNPSTAQQKKQAQVEQLICTDADLAIWFTNQALESARLRHPQLADRGRVVFPGIDPPFKKLPPYRLGPKFVVGHFGSLSSTRNLVGFISALELLQMRRPELVANTELHVYGGPLDAASSDKLSASPVRSCVRHFGRLESDPTTGTSGREQVLNRMRGVDVLLLLHGEESICAEYIPSKLYEYLWMQRPILATVHHNKQMAEILIGMGHTAVKTEGTDGDSIPTMYEKALSTKLEHLFDRFCNVGLPDNGVSSPYTTQRAVEQLLEWTWPICKMSQ